MIEPGFEKDKQQKLLGLLIGVRHEVEKLEVFLRRPLRDGEIPDEISGSITIIQSKLALLEPDLEYIFELLESKHLMMEDNLKYIKQLEAELMAEKTQKL